MFLCVTTSTKRQTQKWTQVNSSFMFESNFFTGSFNLFKYFNFLCLKCWFKFLYINKFIFVFMFFSYASNLFQLSLSVFALNSVVCVCELSHMSLFALLRSTGFSKRKQTSHYFLKKIWISTIFFLRKDFQWTHKPLDSFSLVNFQN